MIEESKLVPAGAMMGAVLPHSNLPHEELLESEGPNMTGIHDPAVQRRRLLKAMRELREERKETQAKVAEELDWSPSKLLRIEKGQLNISKSDLIALLGHYQVTDKSRVDELVEMAKVAKTQTLSADRDVLWPGFVNYLRYESSASYIRSYQPLLIPGLLQSDGYAREIIQSLSTHANDTAESVDRRVQIRMDRQDLLTREDAPTAVFILDEAAVVRRVGSAGIMINQLEYLITLSQRDNVTIRVVPFSRGAYPGMRGPFLLLEFPQGDMEDMLYLEHYRGDVVSPSGSDEVAAAGVTFYQLEEIAESQERSVERFEKIIEGMRAR